MEKSVLDFGQHKTPIVQSVFEYAHTTKITLNGFIDWALNLLELNYGTLCCGLTLSQAMEKGKNPHSGGKEPEKNSQSDLQSYFIKSKVAEMYSMEEFRVGSHGWI